MKNKKVIFGGGGTLGHVLPSFPIIKILKEKGYIIYYVCSENGLEYNVLRKNMFINKIIKINILGFNRKKIFHNIKALYLYFLNKIKLIKHLKYIKPNVVIGMGGYVSAPLIKAALKLKIKTIIHEQNSIFGLVNEKVKNKVTSVLTAYDLNNINYKYIGNPRLSEYYNRYKNSKVQEKDKIVFIGGSRGSIVINDYVINNLTELDKLNYKITLITGSKYYNDNKQKINKVNSKSINIIPYIDDLFTELIDSKIVVCRSGATTISEVFGLGKTTIFIPSPNVVNNHQYSNVISFYEKKMCYLLKEEDISSLLLCIKKVINENRFEDIRKNIFSNVILDSSDLFIKEIIKIGD